MKTTKTMQETDEHYGKYRKIATVEEHEDNYENEGQLRTYGVDCRRHHSRAPMTQRQKNDAVLGF